MKSYSLQLLMTSDMASLNITAPQNKPEAGANGGSRESSEFEFVGGGHGQQPRPLHHTPAQSQPSAGVSSVNPLLLSSNVPAPSPISVQAVPSRPLATALQSPASIAPAPAPEPSHAMTHSLSAPAVDQTAVTRVTAESPSAPGMTLLSSLLVMSS